jgi:hypothetical protein
MRCQVCRTAVLLAVGLGVAFAPARLGATSVQEPAAAHPDSGRRWLGPEGDPLPFHGDDEVLEFLRTAEVVSRRTLPEGINREQQLVLEANGVRARAIFRTVDRELRRTRRPDGRYYVRWVDHHSGEPAAYALARAVGLDFVPPTVSRRLEGREGSLQLWIEGGRRVEAGLQPPSPLAWIRQQWDMELFDELIFNADRNLGNLLAGPEYRLWVYDHGRAFQPKSELYDPDKLRRINRRVWDRLQSLSDDELKDVVREHLAVDQLEALLARRALLAERVQALVDEHGEAAVFY